jgi:hypothetical protein
VNLKKLLILAGAGIILFYVITQPGQAGQAVQDILSWMRDGAEAVITFLRNVFN